MARKRNNEYRQQEEDPARNDAGTSDRDAGEIDPEADELVGTEAESTQDAPGGGEEGNPDEAAAPSQEDLESQGFTPDEVQRLVVISDRAARSSEARAAEAQMRRLRFTRWLIEHGVLDEWSA
jgi:hypothetical protein